MSNEILIMRKIQEGEIRRLKPQEITPELRVLPFRPPSAPHVRGGAFPERPGASVERLLGAAMCADVRLCAAKTPFSPRARPTPLRRRIRAPRNDARWNLAIAGRYLYRRLVEIP